MSRLSIQVLAKSSGIKAHTLRAWEQRYNVLCPKRSPSGQRIYTEDDLKKVSLLGRLTKLGHKISHLAQLSTSDLEQKLNENIEDRHEKHKAETKVIGSVSLASLFLKIDNYSLKGIGDELEHLRHILGVQSFIFEVVLPAIRKVGILVIEGKCSVTQEHIVSSLVREQLLQVALPSVDLDKPRIALATPEGNNHELSIIIAETLCRSMRFPTSYLGAAHPAESLAQAVNALGDTIVVLGVLDSEQWRFAERFIPFVEEFQEHLDTEIQLVLGGGWLIDHPPFKKVKSIHWMKSFEDFVLELNQMS